ncbi:hypothetical protein JN06_01021 [Bacteroides zoogleoformans]|nr:hypothetical protein JN06_01021 [Bacteroides zoogleoformans]
MKLSFSNVNFHTSIKQMADNYLEKQMEQYQARKAAWEKECKYGKKKAHIPASPKPQQSENSSTATEKK